MKRCSWFQLGFVFLVLITLLASSRSSDPRRLLEFKVEFGENSIPAQMTVGRKAMADMSIKNPGKTDGRANPTGRSAVNLSYHWLDRKGAVVVFDGLRTPLQNDVESGYRSSHTMALEAVRARARVLDIGCGSGSFARELAKKSCRVVGVQTTNS
jgi:SAM-dependent methyltransferase